LTHLGLSGAVPSGEVAASFKGGWLRHFKLVLSSAGGAAAAIAVFSLLEKQPAEGFKLLGQWGPWPVIALVALVLVGGFMSRMNETVSTTFNAVVSGVDRMGRASQMQAEASGKTAEALTKLAEQGGRQHEEVRRLVMFTAQEIPGVYGRLDKQDEVLQQMHTAMKVLVNRGRDDH
jgi:hypothetical protein